MNGWMPTWTNLIYCACLIPKCRYPFTNLAGARFFVGKDSTICRASTMASDQRVYRATMAISSWNFSDISPQQETQNVFDPYLGKLQEIWQITYDLISLTMVGRCRWERTINMYICMLVQKVYPRSHLWLTSSHSGRGQILKGKGLASVNQALESHWIIQDQTIGIYQSFVQLSWHSYTRRSSQV